MVDSLQEQFRIAFYRLVQKLLCETVSAGICGNRVYVPVILYLHLELDETHLLQLVHLLDVADVLTVVRSDVNHHRVQLHLVKVIPQLLFDSTPIHLRVLLCPLNHLRYFLVRFKQSIDENTRISKNRQKLL